MKLFLSLFIPVILFVGCKKDAVEKEEPAGKLLKTIVFDNNNISYYSFDSVIYDYDKLGKLVKLTQFRRDDLYTNRKTVPKRFATFNYNAAGLLDNIVSTDYLDLMGMRYKLGYDQNNSLSTISYTDSSRYGRTSNYQKIVRRTDSLIVEQNGFPIIIYKKSNDNLVYRKTIFDDNFTEIKDHQIKFFSPYYFFPAGMQEILFLTGFQSVGRSNAYDPFTLDKLSKNVPGSYKPMYGSVSPPFEYTVNKQSMVTSCYSGSEDKKSYIRQTFYYE